MSTLEGLNTLSVRQSSDKLATRCCGQGEWVSWQRKDREGLHVEGIGNRNNEHRMTAAERGNTWAGEEKIGGFRLEAPQMESLKVTVSKEHIKSKRENNYLRKTQGWKVGGVFL